MSIKTILFYSFKGGVGRTQLLINIAKFLSVEKNKKVVIVDFDLYAPGLSYWAKFNKERSNDDYLLNYLVNFLKNPKKENTRDLYLKKISENLFLVPIYDISNIVIYHKLLQDWSEFIYSLKQNLQKPLTEGYFTLGSVILERIIDKIKKSVQSDIDYILFDARTGLTEVSDLLFSKKIDLKIFISGYNKQNIEGINGVLQILKEVDKDVKDKKHQILRVLSMKPQNLKDGKKLEILKTSADLNHDIKLKQNFKWNDLFEIDYFSDLVVHDFDIWEQNYSNIDKYKKQVRNIGNKIINIFETKIGDDI